ncbi:helix-turn-helix transcriptional regulator [Sphingomonas crusticola]|uniref:helix-turn-helix transcriptional regulator n=1 Tax=Sphingomonas crusticola TaxID=1697973 RepID=UPI000E282283|nr:AraC family transcriptional regulator [Sphingomonas crusticola]
MGVAQFDFAIRIFAIATLLLLAWLLFRQRHEIGMPAWLFLPLAVCLSGFLIGNTPLDALRPTGPAGAVPHFASGFAVVFLWWFCLSCFDRSFRPKGGVLTVGCVWALLASADRGLIGSAAADSGLSYVLIALGFGIVGHLIWRLAAERQGDLVQRRHDARMMVAVLLGGQLLVDLSVDALFGVAWRPLAFSMAQNIAILGFRLWLAGKLLDVRTDVLSFGLARVAKLAPSSSPIDQGVDRADGALHGRLSALIETRRVFLDPDLTFGRFVEQMEAPERNVRKLVNHELGFDHFRTFLNHYRMIEARRLLANPHRSADKLITIALDSGFASLPSFNRVFRAIEGCTPSEYRDALRDRLPPATSRKPADGVSVPGFKKRSAVF